MISFFYVKVWFFEWVVPDQRTFATDSPAAVVPLHEIDDPGYPPSRSLVLMSKGTKQRPERFAIKGRFCIESAMASSVKHVLS